MKRGTLTVPLWRNKGGLRAVAALSLALLVAVATPGRAELTAADAQLYREAIKAAERGRFLEARQLAARARENLPEKLVTWLELTNPEGGGDWKTLTGFLKANPDWPNLGAIRRKAESRMDDLSDADVVAWFDANPPLTSGGATRYIRALMATGRSDKAIEVVRARYVNGSFGAVEERDFRKTFNALLRPQDHEARLDRLLWDGDEAGAKRVMPLVSKDRQAVALARIALFSMSGGVEGALRKVPARMMNDPGLVFERLRWRRKKDLDDGALELLAKAPKDMVRPELWWTERHILARRLIEKGRHKQAYDIVAAHGTRDGLAFAQAEFLAGWLALRFLKKPDVAQAHFEALHANVTSPISLARGAYWAARAAEVRGDPAKARGWYQAAAAKGATFYGLLSAEALGVPAHSLIPATQTVPKEARDAFNKRETVRLVRMLDRIEGDRGDLAELFLRKLAADTKDPVEFLLLGELSRTLGDRTLGVLVSRAGLQAGALVMEAGFPVMDKPLPPRPEAGLVHAIARQESNFDSSAVSSAGARGLMQLMPATAQHFAKTLKLKHTHEKLTQDPAYNVRVGSAYLQDLLDRFNGSYVMAIAAYNAGPGRVAGWVRDYGDPRSGDIDVVDWIETIPFYETRNYVQRVLENLHIYRTRLGVPPVPLAEDLKRGGGGAG